MRNISLFIGASLMASLSMMAESNDFEKYSHELKKADVTLSAPESFESLDLKGRSHICNYINRDWSGATPNSTIAGAVLDNDKEGVAFIYPTVFFDISSIKYGRDIETELRQNKNDMDLDIRPMITVVAENDMSRYANADTAVIFEYKFQQSYLDQYKNCVGVYLRKAGHPALLMRIALSDRAAEHKDKYVRLLLDNISYGDTPHESLAAMEAKSAGSDLNFPTKHRYLTGILPFVDDETLDEVNRVSEWCKAHGIKQLPYFDDETLAALNENKAFRENGWEPAPVMEDSVKTTDAYAMLDKSIYNMATVERQPFYYGGQEAMHKWIAENMKYPAEAIESQTEGKVVIEFIVDENGNVINPQVLKGLTLELNEEAIRLIQDMPDWRAGLVKGSPVKTYYTLPITFKLPK